MSNPINRAIVCIQAGNRGEDALSCATLLTTMIEAWSTSNRLFLKYIIYDREQNYQIEQALFIAEGENAYQLLRSEDGIHRIVRNSPHDDYGRRTTTFTPIRVYPDLRNEFRISLDDKKLLIDYYSENGQKNRPPESDMCVRIVDLEENIEVRQALYSNRIQNLVLAREELEIKRFIKQYNYKKEEGGCYTPMTPIRSYVFNPYESVEDHRTGIKLEKVYPTLDGQLETFVIAYNSKFK